MKLESFLRLSRGLMVQILCYAGIFLSLTISARALSPDNFGIYASSVAIASFAGTVLSVGADRIWLRILMRRSAEERRREIDAATLMPAATVNLMIWIVTLTLFFVGSAKASIIFVLVMSATTVVRTLLSSYFKYVSDDRANIIAIFGLQPMVVGGIMGILLLATPADGPVSVLSTWIAVTIIVEMVQLAILFLRARQWGLHFSVDPSQGLWLRSVPHAKAGVLISFMTMLAQSGPLGLSAATLFLPASDVGIYAVALRISQLIFFPFIGAMQIVVPLASKAYLEEEIPAARSELKNIMRYTVIIMAVLNVLFFLMGSFFINMIMDIRDNRAYTLTLILNMGNMMTSLFGVGDLILVSLGLHRMAFWISVWCGGVLFLLIGGASIVFGLGIVGLAIATAVAMAARAFLGYLLVLHRVPMPVSVFDR